jgi:hypothetical protein
MIDDITIFNLSLSFIFFFFDGNDLNELYASAHECVQSIFFHSHFTTAKIIFCFFWVLLAEPL